jgi:hypothetical protein
VGQFSTGGVGQFYSGANTAIDASVDTGWAAAEFKKPQKI